tara:strand:- start:250 stop:462 length:213 start_codon:yes stop_codon:yes gene_type:complete
MAQVTVRKGEDINRAIRRFKRKVEREGIMRELKKKRYYSKPSVRKKEKRIAAAKRRRKAMSRKQPQKKSR